MAKSNQTQDSINNGSISHHPYTDDANNRIYNLLFGDDLNLYLEHTIEPLGYPFDILFSENSSSSEFKKIIQDDEVESRAKILACHKLTGLGVKPDMMELFGVIVEVGLDEGLDVLASYRDGSARYLNHSQKMVIWETTKDEKANEITSELFDLSKLIVDKIGPWDKPRLPHPVKGNVRVTFLVSDRLYFGEGPINIMFSDPLAGPALAKATALMEYITMTSAQFKQ